MVRLILGNPHLGFGIHFVGRRAEERQSFTLPNKANPSVDAKNTAQS